MATKYQMQAQDSIDLKLKTWNRPAPDWAGAFFPGPGAPIDVALGCAPIAAATPGLSAVLAVTAPTSGAVIQASFSGVFLAGYPESFSWFRPDHLCEVSRAQWTALIVG